MLTTRVGVLLVSIYVAIGIRLNILVVRLRGFTIPVRGFGRRFLRIVDEWDAARALLFKSFSSWLHADSSTGGL
jgi:hypothetical protein